jgi:glycogen synthase
MPHKVLMFGWEFPPYNSGGLGVACLGLTKALVESGVDVHFVLPRKMDLRYDYMKFLFADTSFTINQENYERYLYLLGAYNGFNAHSWEAKNLQEIQADLQTNGLGGDIYSEVMRYAWLSKNIIENEEFDSIHSHDWLTIEPGILAKRMTGKPLFFHVHATEVDRTGGHVNQMIYDIERKGIHLADKVIAVSNFTKKTIIEHYGVASEKVEVVHNGIEYYLEKNEAKDNELINNLQQLKKLGRQIVLFTGRLTFQKGVDYLLQAAKRVVEHQPNTLFVIAGSGDMEQKLLELSAGLGLSDKVIFAGFVRGEKLKSLYACADLFVMPSVSEPFGLVALEAMVHETPVIVSKNSGVQEVLSHALKVNFWDVGEVSELILATLKNPALHQTLTDYGHEEVKYLSWDRAAESLRQFYEQTISSGFQTTAPSIASNSQEVSF